MQQSVHTHSISTQGPGLIEFTTAVRRFVAEAEIATGLLTAYVRHTSCSLVIQENADPDVRTDLDGFFRRLVPEGMEWLTHTTEGADDMPAHIKAALTATSLAIPVMGGKMMLGTWQGVYLVEHRARPHTREIVLHFAGSLAASTEAEA